MSGKGGIKTKLQFNWLPKEEGASCENHHT